MFNNLHLGGFDLSLFSFRGEIFSSGRMEHAPVAPGGEAAAATPSSRRVQGESLFFV